MFLNYKHTNEYCPNSRVLRIETRASTTLCSQTDAHPINRFRAVASRHVAGTQAGGFQGTLPYIAPEVYRGEPHDRMVDWWILAHGSLRFTPREDARMRFHILYKEPTFDADISCNLYALISGLLQKDPRMRIGSDAL